MKLRGIEFGNVLGASGVQGFFGEGYWFHNAWHQLGLDFSGMTFVSKTVTLLPSEGNMPLTSRHTPKEWIPRCVKVLPLSGVMVNAVGLSNPGLEAVLHTGRWQARKEPFLISIMPIEDSLLRRKEELRLFVKMFESYKDHFSAPFGLQINLSCPNIKLDHSKLMLESADVLDIIDALGVPIMLKYSVASAQSQIVAGLNNHPACDAICVSNTLPFTWDGVGQRAWGTPVSPLANLGGGGISGSVLRPLVCNWIARLREAGFTKPVNGGGGILCHEDVRHYHNAGASSIFLGSVATLRPWRVRGIIKQATSLDW